MKVVCSAIVNLNESLNTMGNLNIKTSERLKELKRSLPKILLDEHFRIKPQLKERYDERQINHYLEDTQYHLSYLAESIAANEPVLFNEYLGWAKTFFSTLPVTDEEIILNLKLIRDSLAANLPDEMSAITNKFIDDGIASYESQSSIIPSFITETNPLQNVAADYLNLLLNGERREASNLILNTVHTGVSVKEIYLNIFEPTQKETGRLWQMSQITVAQEHFITAATQMIMSQLYPFIFSSNNNKHKIIVACISGELHEIGARMVADLFEMDGWNSYYYGANTPQSSLISAIQHFKPDVLAISATMVFNLSSVSELISKVKSEALQHKMNILVGGYPFLLADKLWESIGADGFATDAIGAIQTANQLLAKGE
jgi:MerR family transcriptional regulator, light-induced transcriptional regulator